MAEPVAPDPQSPETALLRYYRAKARAQHPDLMDSPAPPAFSMPQAPPQAEAPAPGAPPSAVPPAAPQDAAYEEGRRAAHADVEGRVAPPGHPAPPVLSDVQKEPPLSAVEQAALPQLPELPETTPAAPRGVLGRMWDGFWKWSSLTGEEVHGEETFETPETDEEEAQRIAAGRASLRRKLGAVPAEARAPIMEGATSLEDLGQRVFEYEMAQKTGRAPEDAIRYLHARHGVGVDVAATHADLKDAAFRQLRQEYRGPLTPEALEELRRRAEDQADKELPGILVLPTGLPMVVEDVEGWKKKLMSLPLPVRLPLAILTTPTDLVYRGTISHRSASKWSPLDMFGRAAFSTPLGATMEMVPSEDIFPMLGRSILQSFADLPWYSGLPALIGATGAFDQEEPTLQSLANSPEMVERLIEGSDFATAATPLGQAISHQLAGTPIGELAKNHPTFAGMAVALPIMFLEPDVLSAMTGGLGAAADVAKGAGRFGDIAAGLTKLEPGLDAVREALRISESSDIGDLPREIATLREKSPEIEMFLTTWLAAEMEVNPSIRMFVADKIKAMKAAEAKIPELEKAVTEAKDTLEAQRAQAALAFAQEEAARARQEVWESAVTAEVDRLAKKKMVVEDAESIRTGKTVKLTPKVIDAARAAAPAADKELGAAEAELTAVEAMIEQARKAAEARGRKPKAPPTEDAADAARAAGKEEAEALKKAEDARKRLAVLEAKLKKAQEGIPVTKKAIKNREDRIATITQMRDAVAAELAAAEKAAKAAGKKARPPGTKLHARWAAAQRRVQAARFAKFRIKTIIDYGDSKLHVLPALRELLKGKAREYRAAEGKVRKWRKVEGGRVAEAAGETKPLGKMSRAAGKAERKLRKAEAVASIPKEINEVRRKIYRSLLASFDTLHSIANVPKKFLSGARRFEDVAEGAAGKVQFDPSTFGVSGVSLRGTTSPEQLLDVASRVEGDVVHVDSAVLGKALDEKYGREVFDAWQQRITDEGTRDLIHRIFPLKTPDPMDPVDAAKYRWTPVIDPKTGETTLVRHPEVTFTAEEIGKLRELMPQIEQFALSELKTRAGLNPALTVLRQVEAAPVRFYGNTLSKAVRSVFWWTRRYLSPEGSRYGTVANEHLPEIERVFDRSRATAHAELHEIGLILDPVARHKALLDYIDTAYGVKFGRGDTIGNTTTGRAYWHEMVDYVEMRRTLWEAARKGDLGDVDVGADVTKSFEAFLHADRGFQGLAHALVSSFSETPESGASIGLITAAYDVMKASTSFEDFIERMRARMPAALGVTADDRERAIMHGALSVIHMAHLKKAMTQSTMAFGGNLTVPEAMALNAIITRGTGNGPVEFELAMKALEKVGMTFLRDATARGRFGKAAREISDASKRLIAVGTNGANVHFLPKFLLDDLDSKVGNMIRELQPVAERKGDPITAAIMGLGSAWKRSVTVGFLFPSTRYTLAGTAIGDISQVFAWHGPVAAAALARRTLVTHLPGYGRAMAWASRTLQASGKPGAKWLGSKLDAMTSPLLNGIFLGKTGGVQLGGRLYTFDELRKMLRDDGILESLAREELLRDVDVFTRHGGVLPWIKRWQHEIEAHAEMTQVRLRAQFYFQRLAEGADRKVAQQDTLDALYNWQHGFAEWETNALLKLNVPFYRFFKLAFAQALQAQIEPFTRALDPKFYAEAALGRTKLARYRQIALLQSAIPDWMAQAEAYDAQKENLDEFVATAAMLSGKADWSTGRITYASALSPGERVYNREAFNKIGAYEMSAFPDLTPLVSMGWWMNLHGTLATVLGLSLDNDLGARKDLPSWLFEQNFWSFTGPVGDWLNDGGAAWGGGRVTVSPGEAMIGKQLDAVPMMPNFLPSDVRYSTEEGGGIRANSLPIFFLRMLPFILQIPGLATATEHPHFARGQAAGLQGALLQVLGIKRVYSRDPEAEQEREIRRIVSDMQRTVEMEEERTGTPLRFGLGEGFEPIKKQ